MQDNKYAQAAQEDFDALKGKWNDMRERMSDKGNGSGNGTPDSQVAETAWSDFKEQSEKLRAAGATASSELRGSYEAARDKFKKVMDSYQRG
jgi:hypothetical protein